jgi:hypothetical protein
MVKQNTKINLVSNKYLLYIVFALNILFFGYIINNNNYATIIIFLLTGGLLRCYTGNMLVVLSVALFISVLYCFSKHYTIYEGMTSEVQTVEVQPATTDVQTVAVQPATTDVQTVAVHPTTLTTTVPVQPATTTATTDVQTVAVQPTATTATTATTVPVETVSVPVEQFGNRKAKGNNATKINYAETVDEAYRNLDSLIGKGGIEKLTSQTSDLLQHQGKLVNTMKTLSPLMDQVHSLINSFESVSPLQPKALINA